MNQAHTFNSLCPSDVKWHDAKMASGNAENIGSGNGLTKIT